ncbi:MAG: hypothetical protein C4562_03245 [Actinobacteria bacterium]|nr:MAG: hypothetical protein C4562_03245 [Actinomycetota bacterium]
MLSKEKGSALAEVMVSLLILQAILVAIVPSFMYSNEQTGKNRCKTIAYNLANEKMEYIKSLPYDSVGIGYDSNGDRQIGNPDGVLRSSENINREGYNFQVRLWVNWVDDPFDDVAPTDSDSRDYKQVKLIITELSGLLPKVITMYTNITRQSQEQIAEGGNIHVTVVKLDGTPIEDVDINIIDGPSSPKHDLTDASGQCLFPVLDPSVEDGDYVLTASKEGYVADSAQKTATVNLGQTTEVQFVMEQPGQLIVHLEDLLGNPIDKNSDLVLENTYGEELTYHESTGEFVINNLFPGTWDITANAASYETATALAEITSNGTTEITIQMTPRPSGNLHLNVFDQNTSLPVPYADVKITNLTNGEFVTSQTNSSGTLEIQLEATMHRIEISKENYNTKTADVEISQSGNTFVDALLEPVAQYGSVRVRVERNNGNPRNNIRVRITTNLINTLWELLTGSYAPGECLFTNVPPGNYYVQRYRNGWQAPRFITVVVGQERYVRYRY